MDVNRELSFSVETAADDMSRLKRAKTAVTAVTETISLRRKAAGMTQAATGTLGGSLTGTFSATGSLTSKLTSSQFDIAEQTPGAKPQPKRAGENKHRTFIFGVWFFLGSGIGALPCLGFCLEPSLLNGIYTLSYCLAMQVVRPARWVGRCSVFSRWT